jgi:hypothetical protein
VIVWQLAGSMGIRNVASAFAGMHKTSCRREVALANDKDRDVLTNVLDEKILKNLVAILSTLQFGSVTLIIQNGKVVQIEKNEKFRLV